MIISIFTTLQEVPPSGALVLAIFSREVLPCFRIVLSGRSLLPSTTTLAPWEQGAVPPDWDSSANGMVPSETVGCFDVCVFG